MFTGRGGTRSGPRSLPTQRAGPLPVARSCDARACRSGDICQEAPLKCRLKPYADAHDWDHDLPNGRRREMHEEITRKHLAGAYSAFHFPVEVQRFAPRLPRELLQEPKK